MRVACNLEEWEHGLLVQCPITWYVLRQIMEFPPWIREAVLYLLSCCLDEMRILFPRVNKVSCTEKTQSC